MSEGSGQQPPLANGEDASSDVGRTRRRWRESRWLTVLLVASVALNIFVLGWAGARVASHAGPWMWSKHSDRHAALHEIWHGHRGAFFDLGEEASDRLRDVASALRANPFDEGALAASVDRLEGTAQRLLRLGSDAAKEAAGTLDERERRWAARRIERAAGRMERWSSHRDD